MEFKLQTGNEKEVTFFADTLVLLVPAPRYMACRAKQGGQENAWTEHETRQGRSGQTRKQSKLMQIRARTDKLYGSGEQAAQGKSRQGPLCEQDNARTLVRDGDSQR